MFSYFFKFYIGLVIKVLYNELYHIENVENNDISIKGEIIMPQLSTAALTAVPSGVREMFEK